MKKVIYHQFDPKIYPFKLWVVVTNKLDVVENDFVDGKTCESLDLSDIDKHIDAFIFDKFLTNKESKMNGFLVVFKNKKGLTPAIIAHECSHLSDAIWKHLGEKKPSGEAKAYLIEWMVDCVWQIKTNKLLN